MPLFLIYYNELYINETLRLIKTEAVFHVQL